METIHRNESKLVYHALSEHLVSNGLDIVLPEVNIQIKSISTLSPSVTSLPADIWIILVLEAFRWDRWNKNRINFLAT